MYLSRFRKAGKTYVFIHTTDISLERSFNARGWIHIPYDDKLYSPHSSTKINYRALINEATAFKGREANPDSPLFKASLNTLRKAESIPETLNAVLSAATGCSINLPPSDLTPPPGFDRKTQFIAADQYPLHHMGTVPPGLAWCRWVDEWVVGLTFGAVKDVAQLVEPYTARIAQAQWGIAMEVLKLNTYNVCFFVEHKTYKGAEKMARRLVAHFPLPSPPRDPEPYPKDSAGNHISGPSDVIEPYDDIQLQDIYFEEASSHAPGTMDFTHVFKRGMKHRIPRAAEDVPPIGALLTGKVVATAYYKTKNLHPYLDELSPAAAPPQRSRFFRPGPAINVKKLPPQPVHQELPNDSPGSLAIFSFSPYEPTKSILRALEEDKFISRLDGGHVATPVLNLLNKKLFFIRTGTKVILLARTVPTDEIARLYPALHDLRDGLADIRALANKDKMYQKAFMSAYELARISPRLRKCLPADGIVALDLSQLLQAPVWLQAQNTGVLTPDSALNIGPIFAQLVKGQAAFARETRSLVACSCGRVSGTSDKHHLNHIVTIAGKYPMIAPFSDVLVPPYSSLVSGYLSALSLKGFELFFNRRAYADEDLVEAISEDGPYPHALSSSRRDYRHANMQA